MRKEFSSWIENFGRAEARFVFLTGDLGFAAFENVEAVLQQRFVNVGVCEQNMVSVAAGLAQQGLIPLCYSIAPFVVFRAYEQIRLDVALHNLNVRIVGNGGGYGYGIMGASHHALEDIAALSALQHFLCFVPLCNSDLHGACDALFRYNGPSYLRLGFAEWPANIGDLPNFMPLRKLAASKCSGAKATIVGLGPVLLNTLPWVLENGKADVFAASQLPLTKLSDELIASVQASGLLWVIEEHSARGGLGEHLAAHFARLAIPFRLHHTHALGYPDGLYGSQSYHQTRSGLDSASLQRTYQRLLSETTYVRQHHSSGRPLFR
jgi:transketolase